MDFVKNKEKKMIIDSRYEVIKELGSGIWANVFKVRDIRTKKIFALKLFQKLDTKSLYEKFSAEDMHHITKIQHPNLIHVSDYGNFGKHIYYVSEYYEGKTLRNFKFRKTSLELLCDITVQVCYALNALHSQSIIHKDLKLDNVAYLVKDNKIKVKVMDYGFTKIDLERSKQKINEILPYIAPEIYLGKEAVPESDFYSLGVILYRITTGTLPFSVEKITGFMAGNKMDIFPQFPRELNPDIPSNLEKLILNLLGRNPEDRFRSVEEIISFINRSQLKKYPFSRKWSIVHNIKFSDYLVREDYSHQLLDYMPMISKGNGKIIALTAGAGLGINNVLTLFRYHILTGEYYLFDYSCSEIQKDPFFSLIKEFRFAVENNKKLASDLVQISNKFQKFLYESEKKAANLDENEEELTLDFQTAFNFIIHLSEERPIVFIIRGAQNLTKEAIDFVNFISQEIVDIPILIILGFNNPEKLGNIIHAAQVKIEPLNLEQTGKYVYALLKENPNEKFLQRLWLRSYGNPMFIEQILIDLTQKKLIWKEHKFIFDYDLENYDLPREIIDSIYERMTHLSIENYKHLQKLSSVFTPLSRDLIKYVLKISDKELFFLLKDCINNDLLIKNEDSYYNFSYKENQNNLSEKLTEKDRKRISTKVLKYFQNKILSRIPIIRGIIKHAHQIDDYQSIRKYLLKISLIYMERGEYENAFRELCDVIEVDFSDKLELDEKERKKDLKMLLDTSEWTTSEKVPLKLKRIIREMPDCAERHLIIGSFFLTLEKHKLARDRLEKAFEKAITGRMKAFILLKLGKVYFFQENFKKVKSCLNELEKYPLVDDLMIMFIELKSLYFGFTGKLPEAISIIEEFLPTIKSKNDANYFIKLGSLHNNLAVFLHRQRHYDEAEKNFQIARKIWEKVNYRRRLATVLNNIGDVNLTKGNTKAAVKYFTKALDVCSQVDCKRNRILGLLNLGEANIKLGRFDTAEKFLQEALMKSEEQENKPFFAAIINNLAIAKSKIHNFSYYQKFIAENVPGLAKGKIYKITPLTKTYFYYLHQIGDYEKIEDLLKKSESIFLEKKENEFYYQMYGFLLLNKGEYKKAIKAIELAFEYSQQMQSVYAQVINYIRLNECYLAVGDIQKAKEVYQKAEYLCAQNDFNYWKRILILRKIKIQLLDEEISLRKIIRELFAVIEYVQKNDLYILEIECYEIIIQIYTHLNMSKNAKLFFGRYKKKIENATQNLPEYDRIVYLNKTNYYLEDHSNLQTLKIAERPFFVSENWQEELYDILKLKELTRIKFFIEKTIDKLLNPFYFSIALTDDIKNKKTPFLAVNIDEKKLFNTKFLNNINASLDNNSIISKRIMGSNVLFIPLRIKTAKVGCFIIGDKGELEFQKDEISVLKILRFHLTSILMRINEFAELNNYMELMTKLMKITQKFFMILDLDKLEQEVVSFTLDFIGGTRGFLIRKDKFENYVYKVALDDSKHLLKKYAFISKTILIEVQKTRKPVFIRDAEESKIFDGYVNFDQSSLNIFCAPLIVDDHDYGFLYIDNFNSDSSRIEINDEFMKLLLMQIVVSLKNALQYESLHRKNMEVESLDNLKNDFINIVSHELKTPLVTLHGYINRMQKPGNYHFHEEDIQKISKSVDKLYLTTEDIINFNKYKLLNEINKNIVNINDILQVVVDESENLAAYRHMFFKLEIEDKLPSIEVNWEAFTLLLKNLILNAVRFTKDFGTITIGARHSAFQQEEVNGQESLVVFVQDNGIGIPENELENVFRKFYELNDLYAHKSGTTEFRSSGLGLGLSTAELIVKLHNGKIWLNSKENEGTTVFIAIPING